MVINPRDNVEIRNDGHKYALRDIAEGEDVIKYGMPIGHATRAIARGEHVHVHNVRTNLGEVLEYRYLDGWSWQAIAARLCFSRDWVMKLHARAIEAVEAVGEVSV